MSDERDNVSAPTRAQDGDGFGIATAVAVQRFADVGPGQWWFVHHPDGWLIEIGAYQLRAEQVAAEINAGRRALSKITGGARV